MSTRTMIVAICVWWSVTSLSAAESFQAGAATSNITPPIGTEIIGGFVPFPSRHIHDELNARCLVMEDGKTSIAVVVCDLLGLHRAVSEEARRLIAAETGIPREHVMISATHTHSAGSALGKDRLSPDPALDDYQRFLTRRIADGVIRARNNRRPAKIAFGQIDIPIHVFNRRWHMRPGTVPANPFGTSDLVKMNPPSGSPNLVEPAGPIDPTVSIISVQDLKGRPIAVLSAYSLHYVGGVGAADISADYYGAYCMRLERQIAAQQPTPGEDAPPFVAIMANGTSGDINNIDFRNPRPKKQPYEQIRDVANDVADQVFKTLPSLTYRSDVALGARYREPTLSWRRPTEDQRKWAETTLAAGPRSDSDLSYIYAQRTMRLAEYPETTTVPLQVLKLGDVCVGTMPCEVFCETGLDFKRRCPIQPALMIELAHGYFGYLPTPRQLKLGGYETWIGTNRLESQASEILLDHLLEMAEELK